MKHSPSHCVPTASAAPLARASHRPTLIAVTLSALLALGCSKSADSNGAAPTHHGSAAVGVAEQGGTRLQAKTYDLSLRVERMEGSVEALVKSVEALGGYVAESEIAGTDGPTNARLVLRVPSLRLSEFRSALQSLGTLERESLRVHDVTAAHADVEARLVNARAHEQAVLRLMNDRAATMADVLAVQKELGSAREHVERLEAERRSVAQKIEMTTVTLALRGPDISMLDRPVDGVTRALSGGVRATRSLVVGASIAAAFVLPPAAFVASVLAMLAYVVRTVSRLRGRLQAGQRAA